MAGRAQTGSRPRRRRTRIHLWQRAESRDGILPLDTDQARGNSRVADSAHRALADMLLVDFAEGFVFEPVADRTVEVAPRRGVDVAAPVAGDALRLIQMFLMHLAEAIAAHTVTEGADLAARGAGTQVETETGHRGVAGGADEIVAVLPVSGDSVATAAAVAKVADVGWPRRDVGAMAPEARLGDVVEPPQVFSVDRPGRGEGARAMAQPAGSGR